MHFSVSSNASPYDTPLPVVSDSNVDVCEAIYDCTQGKVHPLTGQEGPEREQIIAVLGAR